MSMMVVVLIVFLIVVTFLTSVKNNFQIKKLLAKKTNYIQEFEYDNTNKDIFDNIIHELTKDNKYNLRIKNNRTYVLSDNISLFTWGFYYLIEKSESKIIIYLLPKYLLQLNIFGVFQQKLLKLSSQIQLLNQVIINKS
ncbi:MAG TPA: hypothetical protein PLE30_10795 [Candidatus Kapabacteria bacterium]|nr:hypothetical protein [Candidatus Kapabacteria bacterium]